MDQYNNKIEKINELLSQIRESVKKLANRKLGKDQLEKKFYEKEFRCLLDLRKLHRSLYQDLELERQKNQRQNESLDKETLLLECLDYQKNQLISNIKTFRSMKTLNYDTLNSSVLQKLNQKDCLKDKDVILNSLDQELIERKKKRVKLEEQITKKEDLTQFYLSKDKQYFDELPTQLKKIQTELAPILDIFQIPQIMLPQQQQFLAQLPESLLQIYKEFAKYEKDYQEESQNIKVEIAELAYKCDNPLYTLSPYEIRVHLNKPKNLNEGSEQLVYQYLEIDENEFFKDIYPITLIIKYYSNLNKSVIQIDRKNRVSTEEIICSLVKGDPGEPMFRFPKNEEEININNRYLYFQWLQDLTSIRNQHQITPQNLIIKLHQRIYTILQLRLQLDKLKNSEVPKFLPGYQSELILSNIKLKYFSKINSSDVASSGVVGNLPFWFNHFESETLHQVELQNQDFSIQLNKIKKNHESYLIDDHLIRNYFRENFCQENQLEHISEIYKLIIEQDKQSLEIAMIIPVRYPQQKVSFKILKSEGFEISKKQWFKIKKNLQLYQEGIVQVLQTKIQDSKQLLPGFQALQLSYQLIRLLEFLFKESESGRKKNQLFQK